MAQQINKQALIPKLRSSATHVQAGVAGQAWSPSAEGSGKTDRSLESSGLPG